MKLVDGLDGIIACDQLDQLQAFYIWVKGWAGCGLVATRQQKGKKNPNPPA
jgi:hypothetical protein